MRVPRAIPSCTCFHRRSAVPIDPVHRVPNPMFLPRNLLMVRELAAARARTWLSVPRASKKAPKIGLVPLVRRVSVQGLRAVDARSAPMRAVRAWKDEIVAALGGKDTLSPQRTTLVDLAARTQLFISHVDSYLLDLPSLINRRRRSLIPIVEQRQRLVESLAKLLGQLSLDRKMIDANMPTNWVAKVEQKKPSTRANGGSDGPSHADDAAIEVEADSSGSGAKESA